MADIGWESEGRILDVKNRTIGIWESDYAALKAERDELQARIDKALEWVIEQDIGSLDKVQAILEGRDDGR